jgi:flagellar basal-body rod protein FlgC
MELDATIAASASGLRAQALRMRVIAGNLANADSVSPTAGGDPYRRRLVTFAPSTDLASGATGVTVKTITGDRSDFQRIYQPGSPAADAGGYVKTSNVNSLIELADMRSAQRAYEANLTMIEASKSLTMRTIDLIR